MIFGYYESKRIEKNKRSTTLGEEKGVRSRGVFKIFEEGKEIKKKKQKNLVVILIFFFLDFFFLFFMTKSAFFILFFHSFGEIFFCIFVFFWFFWFFYLVILTFFGFSLLFSSSFILYIE